jgi:hypothetical protein
VNLSSRVDGFDLADLARAFGSFEGGVEDGPVYSRSVDLNRDGRVDGADLDLLTGSFGLSLQ